MLQPLFDRFIRGREKRIEAIARDLLARLQPKRCGNGQKRREYYSIYYWRNAEKRREQRLQSKQRLGKAHRYSQELKQEERRKQT